MTWLSRASRRTQYASGQNLLGFFNAPLPSWVPQTGYQLELSSIPTTQTYLVIGEGATSTPGIGGLLIDTSQPYTLVGPLTLTPNGSGGAILPVGTLDASLEGSRLHFQIIDPVAVQSTGLVSLGFGFEPVQ